MRCFPLEPDVMAQDDCKHGRHLNSSASNVVLLEKFKDPSKAISQ